MIRVLLIDDEELVRFGLGTVLEAAGDFEVVGEAGSGAGGSPAARELTPDLMLVDTRMPVLDGLAETKQPPQFAVLTTFYLDEYVYAALAAGPQAFCSRTLRRGRPPRPCGRWPRGRRRSSPR